MFLGIHLNQIQENYDYKTARFLVQNILRCSKPSHQIPHTCVNCICIGRTLSVTITNSWSIFETELWYLISTKWFFREKIVSYLLSQTVPKLRLSHVIPPTIPFYPLSKSRYRITRQSPPFNLVGGTILGRVIWCGVVSYSICKSLQKQKKQIQHWSAVNTFNMRLYTSILSFFF